MKLLPEAEAEAAEWRSDDEREHAEKHVRDESTGDSETDAKQNVEPNLARFGTCERDDAAHGLSQRCAFERHRRHGKVAQQDGDDGDGDSEENDCHDEGGDRQDETDDLGVVSVRLQGDGVDEVENRGYEDGCDASKCAEKEEELETHPTPGGSAVAPPDGSDVGVTAQHDVKDRELQPRGKVEEHQADHEANHNAGKDDAEKGSGEDRRVTASVISDGRREGEAGVQYLREEGDGGNLEEETWVALTEQKPASVLPGWGDGVGGRKRLHAAPLCCTKLSAGRYAYPVVLTGPLG